MIEIIKAAKEHFEDISRLEKECFGDPWDKEEIEAALANPSFRCFSLVEEAAVIGYAMLYVIDGESEIINIAVSPSKRKKGLGEMLMKHIISVAAGEGAKTMYLEVREANIPARNLYKKLDFNEIGLRKNYYRNPTENAIVMACEISAAHKKC